jgi:hypothetical protein
MSQELAEGDERDEFRGEGHRAGESPLTDLESAPRQAWVDEPAALIYARGSLPRARAPSKRSISRCVDPYWEAL